MIATSGAPYPVATADAVSSAAARAALAFCDVDDGGEAASETVRSAVMSSGVCVWLHFVLTGTGEFGCCDPVVVSAFAEALLVATAVSPGFPADTMQSEESGTLESEAKAIGGGGGERGGETAHSGKAKRSLAVLGIATVIATAGGDPLPLAIMAVGTGIDPLPLALIAVCTGTRFADTSFPGATVGLAGAATPGLVIITG